MGKCAERFNFFCFGFFVNPVYKGELFQKKCSATVSLQASMNSSIILLAIVFSYFSICVGVPDSSNTIFASSKLKSMAPYPSSFS